MQHALNTVFQNSLYVSANQNSDILDGTHRSQSCQSNHVTSRTDLIKHLMLRFKQMVCFLYCGSSYSTQTASRGEKRSRFGLV